ncbi:MAG: hypothetical protein HYY01_07140 [Chloroflexi bacterium]|nr:hypothetical protein [Chloroflexota bacterium]
MTQATSQAVAFHPRLIPVTPSSWPHKDTGFVLDMVMSCQPSVFSVASFPKLMHLGSGREYGGMPLLAVDRERKKVYFDTSDPARVESELTGFYEHCLADDLEHFVISEQASPGLHEMLRRMRDCSWEGRPIMLTFNGPVSFGMRHTDEKDRPIFYNEALRDVTVKTLVMKARWLYARTVEAAPGASVILRFTEPLLSLYGTSFASLPKQDVLDCLNPCLKAIPGQGAVHCCANIDWPLLMDTEANIIDFDAFEFADKLCLYPSELQAYLDRGGMIAWGLVPSNNDKLLGQTVDSLLERFDRGLAAWEAHGLDRGQVLDASFVIASCSLATMTEELAERAFNYTNEVSARLRAQYFGE